MQAAVSRRSERGMTVAFKEVVAQKSHRIASSTGRNVIQWLGKYFRGGVP
jgi:hypothetical protein